MHLNHKTPTKMKKIVSSLAIILVAILLAATTHAQTLTWSGTGSNLWGASGVWNGSNYAENRDLVFGTTTATNRSTSLSAGLVTRTATSITFNGNASPS